MHRMQVNEFANCLKIVDATTTEEPLATGDLLGRIYALERMLQHFLTYTEGAQHIAYPNQNAEVQWVRDELIKARVGLIGDPPTISK